MTFSIVARCPATGQFGAAVSSSSPAVAARCIRGRSGIGAAASQNITDPDLGPLALDLMAAGMTPEQAVAELQKRPFISYRQVMAIDARNPPVVFTGADALGTLASVALARAPAPAASPSRPEREEGKERRTGDGRARAVAGEASR